MLQKNVYVVANSEKRLLYACEHDRLDDQNSFLDNTYHSTWFTVRSVARYASLVQEKRWNCCIMEHVPSYSQDWTDTISRVLCAFNSQLYKGRHPLDNIGMVINIWAKVLRWWCHHISTCHHYVISFLSTFTHCSSYHYSYTWVQFYQYITTVPLFSRTQSSILGPRWLEYNNIFFILMFTVALLLGYGPHKHICSGIILWDSPFPKAWWYQLLCLVWQHEGSSASSSPMALYGRIRRLPPYTPYNSPSWLWRQTLHYHLCSI